MLLPLHGVVDFTSRPRKHGVEIRCASVLKSSTRKFSEEKMNQIVVILCICLETLIFA